MPKTTKLIRQQLQNKQQQRQSRTNRLRLGLILVAATLVLLVVPTLLVGGSMGIALLRSLRSIPDYQQVENSYAAQNQPDPARYFGRNATGEPVELFQATRPDFEFENKGWVSPSELSEPTLNLVYSQWPEIFLNSVDPSQSGFLSQWLAPAQPPDRFSPTHTAAEFINGEPLSNTSFGRLEADLLKRQIQTNWRPEELAAWHLNSSYFGNQVFGIQTAARFYFGRDAAQLTLPEAAMLMGIPQNPAVNPIDDPAGAKLRQEVMLESLLRNQAITQEQFIAARFTPLDINLTSFAQKRNAVLERFLNSRLEQYFTPLEIASDGLNIITTLDPDLQLGVECLTGFYHNYLNSQGLTGNGTCPDAATLAGSNLFPTGQFNSADSVLAVVIEPHTGQILALSGAGEMTRNVVGQPQQPAGNRESGGMFYPFIYLTALSQGHTLSSLVLDIAADSIETPAGMGPIFLEDALVSNSPAAAEHVLGWMGLGSAFKTASEMGAIPAISEEYRQGESGIRFGFIELAHAYGVLANNGVRAGTQPFGRTQQSTLINQVENSRGDILYEAGSAVERAILPDELTWLINQKLAAQKSSTDTLPNGQAVARVTAVGKRNHDEWTISYTPNLVVAVWAGNLKAEGERGVGQQMITPALAQTIIAKANKNRPISTWLPPSNIVTLDVCWPSGLQPNGLCPIRQGLFVAGTEPILFDTMYQSFLVNSENGNLATSSTPPNRVVPITVQVFPAEARNWAVFNDYDLPPTAYDSIRTENATDGFRVESPTPFGDVNKNTAVEIKLRELNQFDYFRVAAYEGLSPGALQILAEQIKPSRNLLSFDILLTLPFQRDGLYTLLVTGFRPDGSIAELAIPVNADVVGPNFRLIRPLDNSLVLAEDKMLFAEIEMTDKADAERVEYYINDDARPVMTSKVTPFTGEILLDRLIEDEVACFMIRAVAFDPQGNQSEDQITNVCFE
ncbi:MAG: membrane peptidoglycan carboxypeptidase [Cellvibrionaceae bacterium]|jgi:membrane peptidoglycan carboxypeptidase